MGSTYLPRTLEPVLTRAVREFPAVVLTGPRQSGKTTLLRQRFARSHTYLSLELPDTRAAAAADPRGFLDLFAPPVILDEIQYAPDLLPYIKERIDAQRSRTGQYLVSGSQNLLLMQQVAESLAGRAAVLKLLPLSRREREGRPGAPLYWERTARIRAETPPEAGSFWRCALDGGYPELATDPNRDRSLWFASYVQTYL